VHLKMSNCLMLPPVGKGAEVLSSILLPSLIPSLQVQGAFLAEDRVPTSEMDCDVRRFVPFSPGNLQPRRLAFPCLRYPLLRPVSLQHLGRTKQV